MAVSVPAVEELVVELDLEKKRLQQLILQSLRPQKKQWMKELQADE